MPTFFDKLDLMLKDSRTQELLECNRELEKRGLALTPEDTAEIIAGRSRALRRQGRVELDLSATKAIISALSESPYASRDDFVQTVNELYEVFHYIKNATSDFVSDEDLINAIMAFYNNACAGSTELLMGKGMAKIIDNFKDKRKLDDIQKEDTENEWNFDE